MIEVRHRFVTFTPPVSGAYLIGDFTDWDENPLAVTEPVTIESPEGAYVEYAFMDSNMQPLADLTNLCKPRNPWYEYHRCITLPSCAFKTPPRPQKFRGAVREYRIDSKVFASQRTYYVYEPPVPPSATLYVHDGESYYRKLQFHEVAEALLEQRSIEPVRLIFIEPYDRRLEYWFNEGYEKFLLDEILPSVDRSYGETSLRGLWGASLGGMISAWLALRNPKIFTIVGSQSGCFTAHPQGGDYYHDSEWLTEQFAKTFHKAIRFYVDTGQIEWLLAPNRRFAAMLSDKGYLHSYIERPSGHNAATWEQGLEGGLKYLFESNHDILGRIA